MEKWNTPIVYGMYMEYGSLFQNDLIILMEMNDNPLNVMLGPHLIYISVINPILG